jgi:putative ABC transport system ATP-binding protein
MPAQNEALLKLVDITKTYELGGEKISVLKKANVEIKKGEFVAILGPSGSGKSTLMHIMGFLDSPTSGDVYLNGRKQVSYSEGALAEIRNKTIGFVFQQFNLLPRMSAVDNVALPLIYSNVSELDRRDRAKQLLTRLGLGEKLNNRNNQLSGGQQQRVAIARALVNDPDLIFADEPTGNLDSKSGDEVMKILKELNAEGKTIVLVTHEAEVAANAKRQIHIKDGEVVKNYDGLKQKK